jgi:phage terminase small subunit
MPNGLTPQQQWAWNQVVGNIRPENLGEIDSVALAAFARWFAQWADAMTESEEATGKDQWTAICRAGMAWKHCVQLMSKFGMTPADRSKFKKSAPSGPSEANPIAALAQLVSGKN